MRIQSSTNRSYTRFIPRCRLVDRVSFYFSLFCFYHYHHHYVSPRHTTAHSLHPFTNKPIENAFHRTRLSRPEHPLRDLHGLGRFHPRENRPTKPQGHHRRPSGQGGYRERYPRGDRQEDRQAFSKVQEEGRQDLQGQGRCRSCHRVGLQLGR